MEQIRRIAKSNEHNFKFLIFAAIGIGAFNTLTRPDYNLIIYLYFYYVWNMMSDSKVNRKQIIYKLKDIQAQEKTNTFYALLYSFIIDIVWVLFWNSKWGLLTQDKESTIHGLVIFTSWVAILIKVIFFILYILLQLIVIIFVIATEDAAIKASLPSKLREQLNANNTYVPQNDEAQI